MLDFIVNKIAIARSYGKVGFMVIRVVYSKTYIGSSLVKGGKIETFGMADVRYCHPNM